ncbi:hypothetical protein [Paenarthrobacter sp. PH39-S1]|uniref:hypothetical protein n=1 Tax=Micrococcaceae TaxID=1268 RepID=UPI0024B90E48|nr:hypothetical protein [Paenarthrobacter sp. PH39-S1]MDJ0354956.1 hypothetical protein [Paenarthrobacter sp. PH39-S1]
MNKKDLAIVAMDDEEAAEETTGRGTMVIRIWSEEGDEGGFRARLIFSRTAKDRPHLRVAGSHDEILQTVRQWLEEIDD